MGPRCAGQDLEGVQQRGLVRRRMAEQLVDRGVAAVRRHRLHQTLAQGVRGAHHGDEHPRHLRVRSCPPGSTPAAGRRRAPGAAWPAETRRRGARRARHRPRRSSRHGPGSAARAVLGLLWSFRVAPTWKCWSWRTWVSSWTRVSLTAGVSRCPRIVIRWSLEGVVGERRLAARVVGRAEQVDFAGDQPEGTQQPGGVPDSARSLLLAPSVGGDALLELGRGQEPHRDRVQEPQPALVRPRSSRTARSACPSATGTVRPVGGAGRRAWRSAATGSRNPRRSRAPGPRTTATADHPQRDVGRLADRVAIGRRVGGAPRALMAGG